MEAIVVSQRQIADDEQLDHLLRDKVVLLQRKRGYRTSVDTTLLAWFASQQGPAQHIVDLGAGSGLVSILVARHFGDAQIVLVEKQHELAARCQENLHINGVHDRCTVVHHDLADGAPPPHHVAQLVVCNPPFHRPEGRIVPADAERLAAHYETTADIATFTACARTMLCDDGVSCWIYPKSGSSRLLDALVQAGMRGCTVHDVEHRPGHLPITRILVRAVVQREMAISDGHPVAIHPQDGDDHRYSPPIERFVASLLPRR